MLYKSPCNHTIKGIEKTSEGDLRTRLYKEVMLFLMNVLFSPNVQNILIQNVNNPQSKERNPLTFWDSRNSNPLLVPNNDTHYLYAYMFGNILPPFN